MILIVNNLISKNHIHLERMDIGLALGCSQHKSLEVVHVGSVDHSSHVLDPGAHQLLFESLRDILRIDSGPAWPHSDHLLNLLKHRQLVDGGLENIELAGKGLLLLHDVIVGLLQVIADLVKEDAA